MPSRLKISCSVLVLLAGFVRIDLVSAHHSVLAFDGSRGIELSGHVTQIHKINPHTEIMLEVMGADGAVQVWTVEGESAILLSRLGWDDAVIRVGDKLTVIGAPAKNGSSTMRCQRVRLEDGRRLDCYPGLDSE